MIKEVTMYTIICDGCGKNICEGSEFAGWDDESFVQDIAHESSWLQKDGNNYCPECYYYDDEDNLILKTNIHAKSKP